MSTFAHTLARRAVETLIGVHGEGHQPFPEPILTGLQDPAGASGASLAKLDEFVHRLFVFDLPKNFFIQMAVTGSCIVILLIVGAATILSRIAQSSFWIFKATRRSEGTYLVPNALNTFLLFEGVFGIVWLAFIIVQFKGYWDRVGAMQHHIGTLNLIVWWPLWIGAFMAGWGSFYTAPGALDKGPLRSGPLSKLLPQPLMINIFCIGTPIILIISLIPLMVLTQQHLNDAFDAYKILASDLQSAIASGASSANGVAASPQQAGQFLARAGDVWNMQIETAYYMAIGYSIWPVWAGIFLLFYIPAGGYLTYLVWAQVRRQKDTLLGIRQRNVEEDVIDRQRKQEEVAMARAQQKFINGHPQGSRTGAGAMQQIISLGEDENGQSALPDPASSLLFQPLTSSQEMETTAVFEQGMTPPVTPSTAVNGRLTLPEESRVSGSSEGGKSVAGEEKDVFFPALRPDLRKQAAATSKRLSSVGGSPYSRYKYLRRCFVNLTILYVGIVLGAALYLGVSAALGRYLHESYIKGPESITHIVYVCCVVTAWGAVVFGSLCIAAILARFIDPANSPPPGSRNHHEEQKPGHRRGLASPFSLKPYAHKLVPGAGGSTSSGKYEMQDKTRTLPAVPESVGATVDELMTGVSIPVSASHGRTRNMDSPALRQQPSLNDGQAQKRPQTLKFDLSSKPGVGLLLEPSMDPGMSAMSFGLPDSATVSLQAPDEDGMRSSANDSRRTSTSSRLRRLGKRSLAGREQRGREEKAGAHQTESPFDSHNSSQGSLPLRQPSRTLYVSPGVEPIAAPPPPPAKPLAPARSPPLSPAYIDAMDGGQALQEPIGQNGEKTAGDGFPIPRRISDAQHSGWTRHAISGADPLTAPRRPSRDPVLPHLPASEAYSPSLAKSEMRGALLSGIPVSIPAAGLLSNSGSEYEQDGYSDGKHRTGLPRSFQQHRGYSAGTHTLASLSKPSMPAFGPQHSPSVDLMPLSPLVTRRSGMLSTISHSSPPSTALPPTPSTASAYMIPAHDEGPAEGVKPKLTVYTDRQTVPSPTKAWKPVGPAGWYRLPDARTTSEGMGGGDDRAEEDTLGAPINLAMEDDAVWIGSPRRPSLPLPELDMPPVHMSGTRTAMHRKRSESAPRSAAGPTSGDGQYVDPMQKQNLDRVHRHSGSRSRLSQGSATHRSPGTFF